MGIVCAIQYQYSNMVNEDFPELLQLLTSTELYENAASYVDHEALINTSQMLKRKSELLFPDILAIADEENV